MFQNATISSRSSSNHSNNSCRRNSSMPSLRMQSPISSKTSYNPLYRHSDALTSFDASHFIFQDQRQNKKHRKHIALRRYNSQDSHSKFNEICVKSGETFKTNSTNSKSENRNFERNFSFPGEANQDHNQSEFKARDFLERFSLPRVVQVENGEPLLMYRCFDSFIKVQAKGYVVKKGKERADTNSLYFPEGYSGWFSLLNEKEEKSAVTHFSILQLVREQVCSFINLQPFTAYAGYSSDSTELLGKVQYLKTQIRTGQLFQLRGVFQHQDHLESGRHSTKSSRISRSARDKDLANRYAQLISQNNQEYYVPLTTKGEFYEIHSSMKARLCFQGLLDKTGPLALDKDCLYKINHLLRRVALPIRVKLLAGPLPLGLSKDLSDTFVLEKRIQEPLMVTCTLPLDGSQHHISSINLNSGLKMKRSMLDFESENRLFKSQRLQDALAYCHKNVEDWYREVRIAPDMQSSSASSTNYHLNKLHNNRHKIENQPDCDNNLSKQTETEHNETQKQLITKEVISKFPKSKKWYRHLVKLGFKSDNPVERNVNNEHFDVSDKIKSIERYKDMSRLIEDRFGKKNYNPVKKSASFMFSTKPVNLKEHLPEVNNPPGLLKCQSLDTQLCSSSNTQSNDQLYSSENFKSNESVNLNQNCRMSFHEDHMFNNTQLNLTNTYNDSLNFLNLHTSNSTEGIIHDVNCTENVKLLRMSKPDLIPTLRKEDNSYMTDRLCSEFRVKTKVQKRSVSKYNLLSEKMRSSLRSTEKIINIGDEKTNQNIESKKSVVVAQVHEVLNTKQQKSLKVCDIDDIPYGKVIDEIKDGKDKLKSCENIYAEICENVKDTCDNRKLYEHKRIERSSEYCYVKLGSNGDSVTQSDSDEAIYNTLR